MNCEIVQRRLMGLEDPDQVPVELAAHLAACAACARWLSQLVLLERHVSSVPVPSSSGPACVLKELLWEPKVSAESVTGLAVAEHKSPAHHGLGGGTPYTGRFSARWAALIAAVLFVAAGGWWFLADRSGPPGDAPGGETSANDPLLASLIRCDLRLARATECEERLEVLLDMADNLQSEARNLARVEGVEELKTLASLYQRVIEDGIVKQAALLPTKPRRRVIEGLVNRLNQLARQTERLAREVPERPAGLLRDMATISYNGNRLLLALAEEKKP